MKTERYIRRAARQDGGADAQQTIRRELDALIDELRADGHDESRAEELAVQAHQTRTPDDPWSLRAFLRSPRDGATWRQAAYLLALFPLGVASFTWAYTGLGLSIGFAFLVVGFLFIGPFLLSFPYLGRLHGNLAAWGTRQPMPLLGAVPRTSGGFWNRLKARLTDTQIVFGFLVCTTGFFFGTLGFAWITATLSLIVFLVGFPLWVAVAEAFPERGMAQDILDDVPAWLSENQLLMVAAGLLCIWLFAYGTQVIAWLSGRTTRALLTRS